MYHLAVCDDEAIYREQLLHMLELAEIGKECEISEFDCGEALVRANKERAFDLVFLDIEMPGTDGIKTAIALKEENPNMLVIFISMYKNFVSKAFHVPAFQYLYKPVRFEDFTEELDLALEKLGTIRAFYTTPDGTRTIPVKDIVYLEVRDHFVTVNSVDGESYRCRGRMKVEEARLRVHKFIRCHESFLVNPQFMKEIRKNDIIMIVNLDKRIPVSKQRHKEVMAEYKEFVKRNAV